MNYSVHIASVGVLIENNEGKILLLKILIEGEIKLIFSFDTHVHSIFSCDAKNTLEEMVTAAVDKGLKHICFTEHIDHNPRDYGYGYYKYEAYSDEIESLRDKFSSKIEILKGIEFSEPHLYKSEFEKELSRNYDMIMVGLHWTDDMFYGQKELLQKYSSEKILERYFKDLEEVVNFGRFDVLAHFDFPRRYYGRLDADNSIIEQILKTLISKNIIIGINTSGFRKGYNFTLPEFDIIDKYLSLGGTRVTLGSDSHSTEDIASDFERISDYHDFKKLDYGIFTKRKFEKINI